MNRLILLALFVASFCTLKAQTDSDLKKGWDYFAKNNYKLAEQQFKKALNGSQKAEAHLALSLVGAATGNDEMSSTNHLQFFKTAKNPEPYIDGLWSLFRGIRTETELAFLNELVNSENGRLQAKANQTLGYHFRATNKLPKSTEHFAKIGSVRTWQVVGEFENVSESGFDKEHGPLQHPEASYAFKNKYNADVRWFDIKDGLYNGWIDLEYFFIGSNSIVYAQNFCNSPKEQEVQFRVGTSGSVKVWLNDQLMFSESEERNNGLDTYVFTAKLMKGYNRILIQIGCSEIDDSNFMLRITDSKGIPVEGLTYTTTKKNYPKDYSFRSEVIPSPTEQFFLRQIEQNPDALENYLILNQLYLLNQMTFKAKKNLKVARAKFPDCSYLTMQHLWAHAQDGNETEHSACLEEIKAKDPDFPLALNVLFDEAIEIENYREAKTILDKMEKKNPDSKNVYSKKIELASANKEIEKLIELVYEAYAKHPNHYEFVDLRYQVEREVKKNIKGGVKILTGFLKKNYNEAAMSDLFDLYLELGQVPKAMALLEKQVQANPIAVGIYNKMFQVYYHTGNYAKAEETIKECIAIAPYIGGYHVSLGETYSEMKQTAKAKESYERAIYYNPQNYDAREKLQKLQGGDDIFDHFDKIDVYEAFKNSPTASDYPEDNSVILVEAVQKVIYPGGGSQVKNILLVKVFNNTGVDIWKEYVVPVYSNQSAIVEKMEVLKKSGTRIEAQRSGTHIAFPNLEEGDAIHITWKVSNYYSAVLARNFWDSHYFNYLVPIKNSSYSILVPKDQDFKYKTLNVDIEPLTTIKEGFKRYTWKLEDRPAIRDEKYMPVISEVGGMLHLSSFDDWNTIAKWYADLAHAKAKVDFEITETAKTLFEGKEHLNDMEKVKVIYEFIVKNIRYSSVPFLQSAMVPRKASRTLSLKQGDCKDVSTLFVALCKTQNIDANIVLVSTRDYGVNNLPLPAIGFNHAIAKVTLNQKDYYIELTSDNLPFSSGLESIKKVFVLDIPIDKAQPSYAKVINPATRIHNTLIRKAKVSFKDDLMQVDKETWRTGTEAAYMRGSYKDLGQEKQEKKMQEAITDSYPKIKLTSLKFDESLNNLNDTLYYRYGFDVPNIFTEIGKMLIFELPWADKFDNPPFMATDERKYQIDLWEYLDVETYEEELTIDIPAGKKLTEVPKNITISCQNADYSLTYKKVGNQLIIKRKLVIKDDEVKPEHYVEFKKFIGDVVKADKKQIGFTL